MKCLNQMVHLNDNIDAADTNCGAGRVFMCSLACRKG